MKIIIVTLDFIQTKEGHFGLDTGTRGLFVKKKELYVL